ncbi:hypothetical protein ACIQYL_20430 [Lysinibacillus xylanilyticus]|uniref:hypothetical protein n=1 Tax=Lysinibacillus xylanilyticus TaxID=582475 RepID=UPI00381CEC20
MKKKVSIQLKNIHVPVTLHEGIENQLNKEELKRLLIEQVKKMLSTASEVRSSVVLEKATVLENGSLFKHEIYPGRVVRTIHNEIGIVTGIRTKKMEREGQVSVVLPGHRIWYFNFDEIFETAATFFEARCIRLEFSRKELLWHEGDSAYLKVPEGQLLPVVIGKTSQGITHLHEVGNSSIRTNAWKVNRIALDQCLTEFTDEQERYHYASSEELFECYRKYVDKKNIKNPDLKRTEKITEQMTLFQEEIFKLQPSLFERANDVIKELFKQNPKCMETI